MMEQYGILGIAIAVVIAPYAFLLRRRLLETKALLSDASLKYKTNIEQLKDVKAKNSKAEKSLQELNAQVSKFEKQKQRKEELIQELRSQIDEIKEIHHAEQKRQKDHADEEKRALISQLEDATLARKEALEKLDEWERNKKSREKDKVQKEQNLKKDEELKSLQESAKKLRGELKKQNEMIEKMRKALQINRQLKVRHTKLETLYKSMKGLKELTDERNQNWEKALRLLSQAVLVGKADVVDSINSQPLTAMVTRALDEIGAKLVIDEHTNPSEELAESKKDDSRDDLPVGEPKKQREQELIETPL